MAASRVLEPVDITLMSDRLPPFPSIAMAALRVMSTDETTLRRLYELIRPDPAISAEILRLTNSPLHGFSKEITSVLQASMLLGFRRLRSVVVTVGLRTYLGNSFTPQLRACWRHSLACAILAEGTAKWSSLDKDFAYTAGVMHDIGRVALAALFPDPYARLLEKAAKIPSDLLAREREMFGIDHCQAGYSLVTAWELPRVFNDITFHHHEPLSESGDPAAVIGRCCRLADAIGFGVMPKAPRPRYEEVLAEFPAGARQSLPSNIADLAGDIARKISAVESA